VTTREPEQIGERRVTVRKFAQLPLLMMGYHVPETASPDYYALDLLETILFSGQSSRLYKRLVDKDQLALNINGGWRDAFDPTLFTFTSQPKAGVDPAAVEKAIYEELERLKTEPVSERAKSLDFFSSNPSGRNKILLFCRQMLQGALLFAIWS